LPDNDTDEDVDVDTDADVDIEAEEETDADAEAEADVAEDADSGRVEMILEMAVLLAITSGVIIVEVAADEEKTVDGAADVEVETEIEAEVDAETAVEAAMVVLAVLGTISDEESKFLTESLYDGSTKLSAWTHDIKKKKSKNTCHCKYCDECTYIST